MTTKTRQKKVAANVRAYYSRAAYVTPRVAFDKPTAAALRGYMKRSGLGVSDAIRAAIVLAAAASKPAPKHKPVGATKRAARG